MREPERIEAGAGPLVLGLVADAVAVFGTPLLLFVALLAAGYDPAEPGCTTRYARVVVSALVGLLTSGLLAAVALRPFPIGSRLAAHGGATAVAAVLLGLVGFPGFGPIGVALFGALLASPAVLVPVPESWLDRRAVAAIGVVAGLAVACNVWVFARGWDLCTSNVLN